MSRPAPWLRFYGKVPAHLDYPDCTLYQMLTATAQRTPDAPAWDFFDTTANYHTLLASIDRCANALHALGLRRGERLLIALPTMPQGVIAFYAASKLGVVPAMIHPLSTPPEIEHYLNASGAGIALTLDACYPRLLAARPQHPLRLVLLTRTGDYLSAPKRAVFWWRKGRHIAPVPADPRVRWWREFMHTAYPPIGEAAGNTHDPAVILFSGGTTGQPKGIVLSHRNLIAEGLQVATWGQLSGGDSILAILPIFHGFGLGVCVNAAFMAGSTSILVPSFDTAGVARLLRRKRPNLLIGVPTLYAALIRERSLAGLDWSFLRAAFSGADTLPRQIKERFETMVQAGGGEVRLLEGYGLTEAVTAIMAMPMDCYREGAIGVPFPDMYAKICRPGSQDELAIGMEGEICIRGPALMQGYLDQPEATREALRRHADDQVWLHTGDLGHQDVDGFFYFTVRLKRMIKSSGFNIYPAQVEAVLDRHPAVAEACVVGVPDPVQVERVMAFVVLHDRTAAGDNTARSLIDYCHEHLLKWSCPRAIEFRPELPKTRVGKIDYRALRQQYIDQEQTP
jgi:long-chain acyl-CoA synthetase